MVVPENIPQPQIAQTCVNILPMITWSPQWQEQKLQQSRNELILELNLLHIRELIENIHKKSDDKDFNAYLRRYNAMLRKTQSNLQVNAPNRKLIHNNKKSNLKRQQQVDILTKNPSVSTNSNELKNGTFSYLDAQIERNSKSVTCHECKGTGHILANKYYKRSGSSISPLINCDNCNSTGSSIFVGNGKQNSKNQREKPFHCNLCNSTFSRYSSFWSHKQLHTSKPFKCEVCGSIFAKAAYLKNHERVHTGKKPFKCSVCGMQFSQSPHLKNHEIIHSGELYKWQACEKTFTRHSMLWNHKRIHTSEKPYRCNICGSAFNKATHLKNHTKVHTSEKPSVILSK